MAPRVRTKCWRISAASSPPFLTLWPPWHTRAEMYEAEGRRQPAFEILTHYRDLAQPIVAGPRLPLPRWRIPRRPPCARVPRPAPRCRRRNDPPRLIVGQLLYLGGARTHRSLTCSDGPRGGTGNHSPRSRPTALPSLSRTSISTDSLTEILSSSPIITFSRNRNTYS